MVLSSFVGLNLNGEHRCCRAKPPPPLHLDEMFVVLWLSTMLHSIWALVHDGKIYISGGFSAEHR